MRNDPQDNLKRLYEFASAQGGYFTSTQAREAGYAYSQMDYHVKRGTWEKIDRGIYRLRDYPASEREDLIHLTLWSHNREGAAQAVASHETALAIHGLSDVMPARIHLTVPPEFRKESPPHTVLHKARLEMEAIEPREGYYVTRPLRTLLDVADSALSQEHINQAVRDALVKGMVRRSVLTSVECSPKARKKLNQALAAAASQ